MFKENFFTILGFSWIISFFLNKKRNTIKMEHNLFLVLGLLLVVVSLLSLFSLFGF
jgi:hypothetical protein